MCRFQTLTGKNRRNQSRARSNNKVPHCKQDYKQRRENIKTECTNRGELAIDAVIENSQWHGYRLNPDQVRLVVLSRPS